MRLCRVRLKQPNASFTVQRTWNDLPRDPRRNFVTWRHCVRPDSRAVVDSGGPARSSIE